MEFALNYKILYFFSGLAKFESISLCSESNLFESVWSLAVRHSIRWQFLITCAHDFRFFGAFTINNNLEYLLRKTRLFLISCLFKLRFLLVFFINSVHWILFNSKLKRIIGKSTESFWKLDVWHLREVFPNAEIHYPGFWLYCLVLGVDSVPMVALCVDTASLYTVALGKALTRTSMWIHTWNA